MRPARHRALEHGEGEDETGPAGQLEHARVGGRLVAADEQGSDLALGGHLAAALPRPRARRRRPRGRSACAGGRRRPPPPSPRARPRARRGGGRRSSSSWDQTRATRFAARSCFAAGRAAPWARPVPRRSAAQMPAAAPASACTVPAGLTVTTSAPPRRAARSQRSTTGARSTTGSSPTTRQTSASRIAESGARKASSSGSRSSGRSATPPPSRLRDPRERARLLDRLCAGEGDDERPGRLSEAALRPPRAPARSETGSKPRRRTRTSGSPIRSGARRCPWAKRPLSQSQPSWISGWLRERMRATLPSRVVAQTLQPTGQSPQTVGTFWISQGRARKR